MENEIKVGDWIRTNQGHIGKLKRIELDKNDKNLKWYVFDHKEFEINIIKEEYINKPYIVKHSSNLIELIQCGDYVNGIKIISIIQQADTMKTISLCGFDNDYLDIKLNNRDIKTVVTKEQFESISYKVKE